MRGSSVGLLLLLVSCAPAAPIDTAAAPPTRVMETGTGTEVNIRADTRVVETTISAPIDSIFLAATETLRGLGAQFSSYDPAGRIAVIENFAAPRQIAGRRLSTYVTCGSSLSGDAADNARVRLNITMRVLPAQGGGTLQTRLTAEARPTGGASASIAGCSSTGALEAHIASAVRQRVRG